MKYRELGSTGLQVSALGFGAMRLPMTAIDGKPVVDDEIAIPLLQKAVELGINYFDTAWFYGGGDSPRVVGAALAGVRDKVLISTKLPLYLLNSPGDFDDYLKRSLELMGLEYVDFIHFHSLSYKQWREKILPLGLIDRAEKAKSDGLMRHLSFSFHSDEDKMGELIDTGAFSSILGQYNLVDRRNEELFAYAKSKGVGTMVMGPLLGGNLTDGGLELVRRMGSGATCAAEMALRFVWGLPSVDIVLSGMNTMEQLEQNVRFADAADFVGAEERLALIERSLELAEMNDLVCTGCDYCNVCPEGVRPSRIFTLYQRHHVWELTESVRRMIAARGPRDKWAEPTVCTECGECAAHCPQKIDIPCELKRVWPILQGL